MKSNSELYSILKKYFGIDEFRGSQEEIIYNILAGKNCLVMMPTGMGKSLCYQLPALIYDGLTVVISPLISLMKDQVDRLIERGIDASFINSSLGKNERENRYDRILAGGNKIIYVSPERFRNKRFIEVITSRKVSLLALDEAHCVSQWGNDFRPDYSKVADFSKLLGNPPVIALTATATAEVQKDIIRKVGLDAESVCVFNDGICRPNLSLSVYDAIDEAEKYDEMLRLIRKNRGNTIVYFTLISGIEKFAEYLDNKGERYSIYHGKLEASQRRRVQRNFIESRNALMLATNAFGMGIDKPDIRKIIHAEIPDSIESYYQEIGRAGRDGKPSECTLMYCQSDLAVQMGFLEWRNPDAGFLKNTYRLMVSLGDNLRSYEYEDLQEKLVHKNRSDHRLQTALNLFDLYGITEGSIDLSNIRIVSELPEEILTDTFVKEKMERDRMRLVSMLNYVKSPDCRRGLIHSYFAMPVAECGNCDNCA